MSIDNKTALIVGAGIAGSSLAFQLAKRDYQVTLLDDNNHDEIEIFFNKAVEVSPHFMLNNTSYNALMTKASKFSYQLIKDFNFSKKDSLMDGVVKLYEENESEKLIEKVASLDIEKSAFKYLQKEIIKKKYRIDDKAGIYFKYGGWVSPKKLCSTLIKHKNIKFIPKSSVVKIGQKKTQWIVSCQNSNNYNASNLIFCNSFSISKIDLFKDIYLKKNRGQINWLPSNGNTKYKEIISDKGYLIPNVEGLDIFGSTYERDNENKELSVSDFEKNLKTYKKLGGERFDQNKSIVKGWVGMRAVTHDRNPLVGKVLDNSNDLNKKPHSLNELSYYPNLFINIGYGSRGYTLAPFISKSLASMIDSTESSEDEFFLNYLNPYRSWFKKIGLRKQMLLNTI